MIEVGNAIFNAVLPEVTWAPRLLTILLLLGFPVVLVLAWIFDFGPAGITRTTPIGSQPRDTTMPGSWGRTFAAPRPDAAPRTIEIVAVAPEPARVRHATLAFVRHELRTPINAIIGYSEMLLDDARDEGDDATAADLARILTCAREILSLVDRILDADRILAEQQWDLASYGEQVRADLRDPLSAITGYTEMLLETSREAMRDSRTRDLERVLNAARKLLELSNDIVAVATRVPNAAPTEMAKGATLTEGVLSKIRAVQTNDAVPDREGSLLVVDDSVMNRDLLAQQLARKGYVVTTAESGRMALGMMAEQQFDLVLLDVLMDEMDGIEVLRRMKSDAALCSVPVIMISALDEIDSVVRCLEIGAADFVSKPFHPTLLDARIQATLAAHRTRTQPAVQDEGVMRLVAGTFPDYLVQRVMAGDTRALDFAPNAAVCFIDIDQAVAANDPRERASRVEMLIESAHEVAAQHGAAVLLHGIGLLMAAGFPQPVADAPERIAHAALAFARAAETRGIRFRSALHTGALYAALIGTDNLAYSVWGDAVDLSRRMALSAERGQIVVSPACYSSLKDSFAITSKGVIEVAGRGQVRAYVLEGP